MLTKTILPLVAQDHEAEQVWRGKAALFWQNMAGDPRTTFDRFMETTPAAPGVRFEEVSDSGILGWWCKPTAAPQNQAILYLHGGAYAVGLAAAYRGFASQIAARTGLNTFVLDYPLAPEAVLPVAHDLTVCAYGWMTQQGVQRLAVAGDSAGGGLALAALAFLTQNPPAGAAPKIAGCAVFSPWTDLGLSGATVDYPAPILDLETIKACAVQYLAGHPADDPRASPLFGIPAGMPPVLIQVGIDEMVLDDARRYAEATDAVGNAVTLEIWEGMHHVFPSAVEDLVSSRRALDYASDFLVNRLSD